MTKEVFQSLKISEVASINARSVRSSELPAEIEYIDISSVGIGEFNETPARLKKGDAPGRARRIVSPGDTIISTVRPNRRSFLYLANPSFSTIASTGFAVLSPNSRVVPQYLYYWISRPEFSEYLARHAKGAAYPAVAPEDIGHAKILLPSLPVQKQIAVILSAYDDLIRNNSKRITILEKIVRIVFEEWFLKYRYPGHQNQPLAKSFLGQIPANWPVKKITEAISVNPRTEMIRDGSIPFVPMGSLSNDSMLIQKVETRSSVTGAKYQGGDTLFARITPCLENGKTGFVQFLSTERTGCGSTELIVLRSQTLCPEYVYLLARTDAFRGNAIKSMSGATGRQRVKEACFDNFKIAHPDSNTINAFQGFASSIFQQIYTLFLQNRNLQQTRDLLLPRLISGKIDLSQMEKTTES